MKKWNKVYSKNFGGMWYPNENVVRFTARYLKRRIGIDAYEEKKKVRRVLDAGCGNGRHVVFFAELNFEIYGFDISKEAIKIGRAWLAKEGLKANLQVSDIKKLPFKNEYFDLVISFGVLDHIPFLEAKKALQEIHRVLTPEGYLFISLRSTDSSECGRGKKVAKNNFILAEGYEKGLIQHYFDLKEIKELLKGFRVFDIELHEEKFPDLFTLDKSFLQSFKGVKKYIDLSKSLDLNLKESRWYIAAEKI
jgi:SAM-dependent methyltransferase